MSKKKIQKVIYVTSRFPIYSHTFTAYEMATIQQLGVDTHVASVWKVGEFTEAHNVEKEFLDKICDLKLTNPQIWVRALLEIIRKPLILGLIFQLFLGQFGSIYAMLKFFACLPKGLYLGYWVRKNQFQHIHAHFLTTPTTAALLASAVSGVPYTVTIHAHDIFATTPQDRNTSVPLKCARAAANIVISQFNLNFIRSKWPDIKGRFELIHNGIDVDLFTNEYDHTPDQNVYRILSNGRLVYTKGHSYLIEAVAQLIKQDRKIHLKIIGRGPYEEHLRGLCKELNVEAHVEFVGFMPQDEVIQAHRMCDLFVLACAVAPDGDMDGLPTVLIESLSMEIPAISTQVSGIPEVIQDKVTGLCIEPHNSQALAEAIAYMMDHPDESKQMAKNGRALVVEKFNRLRNAQTLLKTWESL